jgi:N-acetylmuramoyl-L-alanine amidase
LHANEQNFEIAKKENSVIYLEDNYESRYAEYDLNSPESVIGLTIMQEEFLDQSIMLAKLMQDEFSGKLKRNDRKVKQAGFIVLHQTFMPSVLVETGFLTNRNEGSYLNSSRGQLELGRAIADAILVYKQNVRSQPGTLITSAAPPPSVQDKGVAMIEPAARKLPEITSETPRKEEPIGEKQQTAATVSEIKSPQTLTEDQPVLIPAASPAETNVSGDPAVKSDMKKEPSSSGPAPVEEEVAEASPEKAAEGAVEFKVQLMASSRDLPLRPDDFNGLGRLSKEPFENLYRYFYGSTPSYSEAKMLKTNADMKGYTSSFIVAYKDGVRISVKEAMKYVQE